MDGERTWIKTWGNAREEPPAPFTEATRFEIGSVSKVFAGLLFADAVQRGEVGWADLLSRRVPDVHVAEYPGTPITLLDVATQAVGFPTMPSNWQTRGPDQENSAYTLDSFREYLRTFQHHAHFLIDSLPKEATTTDVTFEDVIKVVAWIAPAHIRGGVSIGTRAPRRGSPPRPLRAPGGDRRAVWRAASGGNS